ncbi:hypothetical protein CapIbe_002607 [Capra ibex]
MGNLYVHLTPVFTLCETLLSSSLPGGNSMKTEITSVVFTSDPQHLPQCWHITAREHLDDLGPPLWLMETCVRFLVQEDPTSHRPAEPMCHNC